MGSDDVRRAAVRVQQLADDVRRLADRMLAATGVQWWSSAAAEFRERLSEEANGVRSAGGHLEQAAESCTGTRSPSTPWTNGSASAATDEGRRANPDRRADVRAVDQPGSGLALPSDLTLHSELPRADPDRARPGPPNPRPVAVPRVVAASLALHGCADLAITLRLWAPAGGWFACFVICGDVGASVLRDGDQREIGLFRLSALVGEVVRLVPVEPPADSGEAGENVGLQLTVLAADGCARRACPAPDRPGVRRPGPGGRAGPAGRAGDRAGRGLRAGGAGAVVRARGGSDSRGTNRRRARASALGGLRGRHLQLVAGAGRSPLDLTGDLRLLSGDRSSGLDGLLAAMRALGVGPHEPVLLVGHSQGGLIAAAAAADPAARREFSIQRVRTTRAPIASIPVPADVRWLAVEHTDDLVPRLDGASNQDRAIWAAVSARSQATGSNRSGSHGLGEYQRTAERIDHSTDPSVVAWRAGTAPFLGPPTSSWDVELSRVATS